MLQDEPLEYIQEQYEEKNMVLSQYGEEVSPFTLYEDIFGDTEQTIPVVFIDEGEEQTTKHIVPMNIAEAIEQCEGRNDMLMGGCTYFNNWISKKSAKDIYSFIIDMDNVYSGTLLNALRQDWKTANGEVLPMPTYIVNSGTGLHLYFVLVEPIPNYKATTENLDKLYRALAIQQTTKRVYLKKQVQWFGQDFRMAGGLNKYNWKNTVFRVGDKWDIDELGKAVGLKDVHFVRYGEKRTKKPMAEKKPRVRHQGWWSNRAFYDYVVRECKAKTKEGNRYTSMCALSVIAWKCNVPQAELEKDLLSLLPGYNKGATRKIKEKEIYSAMKMYNPKAMLTQRESLENWQGWEYKPIKRNGRKQADHIKLMNFVRDEINGNKNWRDGNGRPNKGRVVYDWRQQHPDGRKVDCIRDTKLSKPTVYRWWNSNDNVVLSQIEHTTEFICRGCSIGNRKYLWYGFKSSNAYDNNNTYMIFEPEPDNQYDSNAVKVVFKGELFGTVGYVGKEFTSDVKRIIDEAQSYVIEIVDENQIGSREINMKVVWCV